MSDQVMIVEVGPRDGLQNIATPIPADVKVELIERLGNCGLQRIEVTSFVRADRIPQLADADEVARRAAAVFDGRRIALAPNIAGLDRAAAAGVDEVAVFAAASETFSGRNLNRGVAASLEMFRPVVAAAKQRGFTVRGYASTVLGCPYEGAVALGAVVSLVEALVSMGCDEISLGDTIGVGTPAATRQLIRAVSAVVPIERLAVHMHDTYGMGLANSMAAFDEGVRIADAAVGGLGGCPYAGPGARGNLATEDLLYALGDSAMRPVVDLDAIVATAWWLSGHLGRPPESRVATAWRSRAGG